MAKLQRLKPRLATLKPTHQITTPKKNWGNSRGGRQWRRKRDQIFKRDNYTCQVCNRIGTPNQGKDNSLELDHIINIASGGTENDSNLQTICHTCHKQKTQQERLYSTINGRKKIRFNTMPEWLKPNPNAILVFGASGSGKTTWANNNKTQGQAIIDLDQIASQLTGKPLYHRTKEDTALAIRERNKLINQLSLTQEPCIIILTGAKKTHRDWWINKIKPMKVIIMDTTKAECIKRIQQDTNRPEHIKQSQIHSVMEWEN